MVDVSSKEPTRRTATASGRILIPRVAYELITIPAGMDKHDDPPQDAAILAPLRKTKEKARSKGDVLTVAQLAAIIGCKRTWQLIPLCHPLALSHIAVTLHPETHRPIPSATRSASGAVDATRSDCDIGAGAGAAEKKGSQGLAYSIVCRATVSCEGKTASSSPRVPHTPTNPSTVPRLPTRSRSLSPFATAPYHARPIFRATCAGTLVDGTWISMLSNDVVIIQRRLQALFS